jgi:hypothetical protein
VLQQGGCDLETKEITWVSPRPGFEILFQLIPAPKPIEGGRFGIRDISALQVIFQPTVKQMLNPSKGKVYNTNQGYV